jgi:hypothetical protein
MSPLLRDVVIVLVALVIAELIGRAIEKRYGGGA